MMGERVQQRETVAHKLENRLLSIESESGELICFSEKFDSAKKERSIEKVVFQKSIK